MTIMTQEQLLKDIADYLTRQFIGDFDDLPPDECLAEAKEIYKKVRQYINSNIEEILKRELPDIPRLVPFEFANQQNAYKDGMKTMKAKMLQWFKSCLEELKEKNEPHKY